jgi:hypothetical protein
MRTKSFSRFPDSVGNKRTLFCFEKVITIVYLACLSPKVWEIFLWHANTGQKLHHIHCFFKLTLVEGTAQTPRKAPPSPPSYYQSIVLYPLDRCDPVPFLRLSRLFVSYQQLKRSGNSNKASVSKKSCTLSDAWRGALHDSALWRSSSKNA